MFTFMFYGGLILAVICLILSIILFIKNDVAKLMADITGWSAKAAVKKMNNQKASMNSNKKEMNPLQKLKEFFRNLKTEETTVLMDNSVKRDGSVKTAKPAAKPVVQNKATKEQVENIFQAEEDMVVLAGKKAGTAPLFSKAGKDSAENELEEMLSGGPIRLSHGSGDAMSEVDDILYGKERKPAAQKESTLVLGTQATDVLGEGERLTTLLESGSTDVLPPSGKPTDVLETSTDLLNKSTDILQDDDDEDTNDDITDVLTSDEEDLEETDTTEVLTGGNEDSTDVLTSDMSSMAYEQPLPDIFDVQDTATVVHTKDKI